MQDAREAVQQARSTLGAASYPPTRVALEDVIAAVLSRLGAVDESLALVSRRPGWPVPVRLVQVLVERGDLKVARDLVDASDDPFGAAELASTVFAKGQAEEAKNLTRTALMRLDKTNLDPDERDPLRLIMQKRLLLRVMAAGEAVEFVGKFGSLEDLATLAVALVTSRQPDLGRDIALRAAERAKTSTRETERARTLVKVAEALARSGSAERALAIATAIEESEARSSALAYVAYAFAREGNEDRARKLIREIGAVVPAIRGRSQRSSLFVTLAMTHLQLGNYAAAWDRPEGVALTSSDLLSISTAIIRDEAIKRNATLRDAFDQEQTGGLGRYGLRWP
jgi:hypothetical protein